ncbi:MAG TPA: hypothetical protein VHA52_10780, partial [Candidatus Babeliaceae bacterium]|nr:hypothetical protein [Candidatus Babeliaceae bacterium]
YLDAVYISCLKWKSQIMNKFDIEFLESFDGYPSVSCYLPTSKSMPEKAQDSIALKNLITTVKKQLAEKANGQQFNLFNLDTTLDKLYESIDFSQASQGLALFASADCARVYLLPFSVPKLVSIDTTFNVRPLLRGLQDNARYWLLVLDEEPTRLFEGRGDRISEFVHNFQGESTDSNLLGFPITEELPEDDHIIAVGKGDLDGRYREDRKLLFFRRVDNALAKVLEKENLPLIIAGTEKNRARFKEVSRHKGNIIGEIEGDYVKNPIQDCIEKAHNVIKAYNAHLNQEYLNQIEDYTNKKQFVYGLQSVWKAAYDGRIKTLLIEEDYTRWGNIDMNSPEHVVLSDSDKKDVLVHDITELLIELVISKQGQVVFYSPNTLSKYEHIAALLRY